MFIRLHNQAENRFHHRVLLVEAVEPRTMLSVVSVDTDQDIVDPNDQLTSLREAIVIANDLEGVDETVFEIGRDEPATICLERSELKLTDAVKITGHGRELLTIDVQHQSRVFNITAMEGDFAIVGLTLTGGQGRENGERYVGGESSGR